MTSPFAPITLSVCPSLKEPDAMRVTLDVDAFLKAFSGPDVHMAVPRKDAAPMWSPILWGANRAKATDAEAIHALCYDLDWDEKPDAVVALEELKRALVEQGWLYALHETFTKGRWRLILPLSAPLLPHQYATSWALTLEALGLLKGDVDDSCVDLGRRYYVPSKPVDAERESESGGRFPLTPHDIAQGLEITKPIPQLSESERLAKLATFMGAANPADAGKIVIPNGTSELKNLELDIEDITAQLKAKARSGETRDKLLAACKGELRMTKGGREDPLHGMVCQFVTHVTRGVEWAYTEAFFQTFVVDKMDFSVDGKPGYYMGKVQASFDKTVGDVVQRREGVDAHNAHLGGRDPTTGEQVKGLEWKSELRYDTRKDGARVLKKTMSNVQLILENDPAFKGHVRFNELKRRLEITGGELRKLRDGMNVVEGVNETATALWLERSEYQLEIGTPMCGELLLYTAKFHRYDPVKDYLHSLKWDGKPRIHRVLHDYCGAEGGEKYIENISKKFFISAAARALSPGEKVDTVLVLQGPQGIRKTSFVSALSKGWYTTFNNRVDDKDSVIAGTESWLVEMGELSSMQDSRSLKNLRSFLSNEFDRIRLPYARAAEDFKRRCVFVGTTNDSTPLSDPDGSRRFWVVSVKDIDIERLVQDRDQLWAEAVTYFEDFQQERASGKRVDDCVNKWWLTKGEQFVSDEENSVFQSEEPLLEAIQREFYLKFKSGQLPEHVSAYEIGATWLNYDKMRLAQDKSLVASIASALKKLGWKKERMSIKGHRANFYYPPTQLPEQESR